MSSLQMSVCSRSSPLHIHLCMHSDQPRTDALWSATNWSPLHIHLCMCTYMHMYIDLSMHMIHIHTYVCVHISMNTYIYHSTYSCVCVHICIFTYMYVCISYVCIYI